MTAIPLAEMYLRAPLSYPNKGATNEASNRIGSDDEPLEGAQLLTALALAASITLSPVQQAAHIPAEHQAFAACVSARESHGNAKARGDESSARGRWQFLDTKWRVNGGLTFMVADRLVRFGMPKKQARAIRRELQAKSIDKWAGVYQDIGFVEVVSRGGWRHWALKGSRCNSLAVN